MASWARHARQPRHGCAEGGGRVKDFKGYTVTEDLLDMAKSSVIFMHDMPAHRGEEIDENVLDSSRSVAFDQAENRLFAQKAIMHTLFSA